MAQLGRDHKGSRVVGGRVRRAAVPRQVGAIGQEKLALVRVEQDAELLAEEVQRYRRQVDELAARVGAEQVERVAHRAKDSAPVVKVSK